MGAMRAELLHSPDKFLKKGLVKATQVNLDSRALKRCSTVSEPNSGEYQSCPSKRSYGGSWGHVGG